MKLTNVPPPCPTTPAQLPPDLCDEVLSHLTIKQNARVACVSRTFRDAAARHRPTYDMARGVAERLGVNEGVGDAESIRKQFAQFSTALTRMPEHRHLLGDVHPDRLITPACALPLPQARARLGRMYGALVQADTAARNIHLQGCADALLAARKEAGVIGVDPPLLFIPEVKLRARLALLRALLDLAARPPLSEMGLTATTQRGFEPNLYHLMLSVQGTLRQIPDCPTRAIFCQLAARWANFVPHFAAPVGLHPGGQLVSLAAYAHTVAACRAGIPEAPHVRVALSGGLYDNGFWDPDLPYDGALDAVPNY